MTIEPDTKDWTWVLSRSCPDCGFDSATVDRDQLAKAFLDNATSWAAVLERDDTTVRPADNVWSPSEYACHVRDVHRVFHGRVEQMLAEDSPAFANWDQDETAIDDDYLAQDPAAVSIELAAAAQAIAVVYASVDGNHWDRSGTRSDGSHFTVDTIGRYHLHDVVHHLYDVSG